MAKSKGENKLKIFLVQIFPTFLLIITLLLYFWIYFSEKDKIEQIENDGTMTGKDVVTGNITEPDSFTGIYNNSGDVTNLVATDFEFTEDCIISNQGKRKVLEIFDNVQKSPINPQKYENYTKLFKVFGNIEDAKLCIVADVVDYRKKHQYTYSTYIIFGSSDYAGHINVGYSKNTNVMYDKTSGGTPDLDGRFWGDETPKIYNLNLNSVKVADTMNGGTKAIYPLKRLQQKGNIRIGGFVNAKNGEGRINKFILAYKCENESDCVIK